MADQGSTAQPPSIVVAMIASGARHVLTAGAGILMADGIVDKDQGQQIVMVGLAVVSIAISVGWSYVEKHNKITWLASLLALAQSS